jgi:hypothetical protein
LPLLREVEIDRHFRPVTTHHVIDRGKSIEITTDDGKRYPAKLVGADPKTDLVLLKVEGGAEFPSLQLADKAPRIGEWILAIGNPFGLGGTVTAGIISARAPDIGLGEFDDFLQIDAPVNTVPQPPVCLCSRAAAPAAAGCASTSKPRPAPPSPPSAHQHSTVPIRAHKPVKSPSLTRGA